MINGKAVGIDEKRVEMLDIDCDVSEFISMNTSGKFCYNLKQHFDSEFAHKQWRHITDTTYMIRGVAPPFARKVNSTCRNVDRLNKIILKL